MAEERSTAELIELLGNDVDRCFDLVVADIDAGTTLEDGSVEAEYEFHARQFIRALFAFIEGITFSMRIKSCEMCLAKNLPLSDGERQLAGEIRFDLNNKGEVQERTANIPLEKNLRFTFVLCERAFGSPKYFDPSTKWWSDLIGTLSVRDRLMHPRMPGDVDVLPDELTAATSAYTGFRELAERYALSD